MNYKQLSLLTLLSLAVACGGEKDETSSSGGESGKLVIASIPAAEVWIGGKSVGTSPIEHEIGAGSHEITLKTDGFADTKTTVEVASGKTVSIEPVLKANDPTDPVALSKIAKAMEFEEFSEFEPEMRHRGSKDDAFVVPLYPRGNVRVSDLSDYRIDVGEAFEGAGKLVFKRGSTVLHEAAFDPEDLSTTAPMPQAVIDALKKGATVTWGFYPEKGKSKTAKFKVVGEDSRLQKRVAKLEKRMADQPEVLVCQMRAQLFLNKRLYLAAYREGLRAVSMQKGSGVPSQALAVMQNAVRRMDLKDTPLWDEVQGDVEKLSAKIRERRKAILR